MSVTVNDEVIAEQRCHLFELARAHPDGKTGFLRIGHTQPEIEFMCAKNFSDQGQTNALPLILCREKRGKKMIANIC